ncbi:exopolysaccharide biosynthesis polyprenyl glycosylphosphotransferase [Halorientalis sp. IM1011]|uniref:exopolysaccharide biosynthesis polyprenyl glycosylphosphotransferase n=1 Tax=Halorientalis sp. IM1011 TaxID=1932360 RepID=UPI00097CCC24|nr:exopolysaccharide biosynthesis polyprenyl glycosylphosphotransferase [Halorientalis sp. IM1011]AQL43322.1 exopolysaccharide biosynthesis polyprenyl glycosylphosphotransferase [Halorientalis sp. IM1011]
MATGWRYRVASVLGTASLTAVAVWFVNYPLIQDAFSQVPVLGRPAPAVLSNGALVFVILTALVVVLGAMWPLFKPRPRRVLATIILTQKRVFLAMVGLAALGYFDYNYRMPRATLMLGTAFLLLWLPAWMVAIRRRPSEQSRAIIVGDDPTAMEAILEETDLPVIGYVSPPSSYEATEGGVVGKPEMSDGGAVTTRLDELSNLGGLSRLDEVLVKYEIDTALLAFADTDRAEFFGTLDTCFDHGVTAMVHRNHAEDVLTAGVAGGELVEVDLNPWDWQDYVVKRVFDVCFSACGLVVLSPVILAIAVAIKLDSPGPVLYSQERTAEFGDTFTVYKFRSMIPEAEAETGAKLSAEDRGDIDPRVTRVGRFLRKTHLDEIPQLWSILTGDMSVVGPRPERPELDTNMESGAADWRRRWFVKPGLTGLAQINAVTGHDPQEKLRYDIKYIRRQSFWFDVKIVIRQIWQVLDDLVEMIEK